MSHPSPTPLLAVALLGPPTLSYETTTVDLRTWGKRKARLLLLLLLSSPELRASRAALAATLWPSLDAEAASKSLYPTLHSLRASLATLPAAPTLHLTTEQLSLSLPAGSTLDWQRFLTLAQPALARGDAAQAEQAVSLYRGPLDPDPTLAEWVQPLREHLDGIYERLLLLLGDWHARLGQPTALAPIERLLAHQSTHEGAVQRLLLLHAQAGRRDTAQRIYKQFQQTLAAELDLAPLPETAQIGQAVRRDQVAELPLERWGLADYRPPRSVALPFAPPAVPLLGRAADWQRLMQRAATVRAGTGQAVLLSGAAGIGKTHLALHLATALHQEGWHILLGSATLYERPSSYGPLIEALAIYRRQAGPLALDEAASQALEQLLGPARADAPSRPLPPASELLLHLGLLSVFETITQRQPVLLILDDTEWADPSTYAWLRFVLRRLGSLRLLVLISQRPAELAADPALQDAWQRAIRQQQAGQVALGGLDDASGAQLVALLAGAVAVPPAAVAAFLQRAEGNPLFLRELVGTWLAHRGGAPESWSLPAAMVDAVLVRLGRLSSAACQVAQLAALAEGLCMPQLLAAVAELPDDDFGAALSELIGAQLVRWQGETTLSFEHQFVREVLVDILPSPAQERLHGRLVAAATSLDPPPAPAVLLHHVARAAATDEHRAAVVRYGLAVGAAALQLGAMDSAAAAFEQAVAALQQSAPQPVAWRTALLGLGRALYELGRYEAAAAVYQDASAWTAADPPGEAQRLVGLGWIAYKRGDRPAASAHFAGGVASALPGSEVALDAQLGLALLAHLTGHADSARTSLLIVLAYTAAAGASSLRTRALNLLGATYMEVGQAELATQFYKMALVSAASSHDLPLHAVVLLNLANLSVRGGHIPAALEYIAAAERANQQLGHDYHLGLTYSVMGWALFYAGDLVAAAARMAAALELLAADTYGQTRAYVLNDLTAVRRAAGDLAAAESLATTAQQLAQHGGFHLAESVALRDRALIGLERGTVDGATAEQWAREALAIVQPQGRTAWESMGWVALGQILAQRGQPAAALAAVEHGLGQAIAGNLRINEIEARLAWAEIQQSHDRAASLQALALAEQQATACGAGLLVARAQRRLAALAPPAATSGRLPAGYEATVLALFDADPRRSLRTLAKLTGEQRHELPRNHHTIRAILVRHGRLPAER